MNEKFHSQSQLNLLGTLAPNSRQFFFSSLNDYLTLTKPEVTLLVVIAVTAGFLLASPLVYLLKLAHVVWGTALLSSGTATLNHYLERELDARMRRTMNRPLPAGRLHPKAALMFGLLLSFAGAFWLLQFVNLLTSVIGVLALLSYLLVYTPLKRRTSLCTFIGALPGAAPALMGWSAACGGFDSGAWLFFVLLLVWQFPHFLSIAWIYREDYQRAEMVMLPPKDVTGDSTFRKILLGTLALLPLSLMADSTAGLNTIYVLTVLALGVAFLAIAIQARRRRTRKEAMNLLMPPYSTSRFFTFA